ncbi:MAG: Arabinose efflux permease [Rhodobacteraceae bacterium HLUCCA12]|nr:MAG: Arabinose efflux permease [Rhodobacteraceae bacterium HLUCCA12]
MFAVDSLDSRYSWFRLAIALVVATIGNVGIWSIVVILPAVQADFGIGRGGAAFPYTLTMLGFALGNVVFGRIVDRFGIHLTLAGAALTSGTGYLLAAASPTLSVLAMAQFLIGLGTAAGFGPLIADTSLWFRRFRGLAVAIVASGNYLSGAIWPIILATPMAEQGWRPVMVILGVTIAGLIVPLAFLMRRRLGDSDLSTEAQRSRFSPQATPFSPRLLMWLLALAGLSCCMAMAMPQVHIVALCVDLGYGPAVGAEMLSLMLLGGVVSRIVSGFIADRLGGVLTLLIGSILQMVALFLYLPFDGMASLYAVSLVFGLAQGGIVPAYAIIVREYLPAREAGARVGLVIMATILGMALGGWLSGVIYDLTGSYRLAFVNGIAWNALNIAIMLTILFSSRFGKARATGVAGA